MSAQQRDGKPPPNEMVRRLAAETGISEAQAQELVSLIGADWPSLVREARLLRVSMQAALTPSRVR